MHEIVFSVGTGIWMVVLEKILQLVSHFCGSEFAFDFFPNSTRQDIFQIYQLASVLLAIAMIGSIWGSSV